MKNLLSFGNTVSLFFLVLLFASVVVIFSFDESPILPYASRSEVPSIELSNSTAYRINDERLSLKLSAKNAARFEAFDEFYDVTLEQQSNDALDKITAPQAIMRDEIVYFDNGVRDLRDEYELYSQIVAYDLKTNVFRGSGEFEIKGNSQNIRGEDIFYDVQNAITRAKNIKAKLRLEKNK